MFSDLSFLKLFYSKRWIYYFRSLGESSKGGPLGEFSHVNLHTHPLFWLLIGREHLASDWSRGCHRNGKPRAKRIVGSRGSHMTGTGSDVTPKPEVIEPEVT